MARLILTTDSSGAGGLMGARLADIVIDIEPRLVWGPLPSDAEAAAFFATRTTQGQGPHWQDYAPPWRLEKYNAKIGARTGLGLIEFCLLCEQVELWIDPVPNAQMMLIWLLDYFRSHGTMASDLTLCQADVVIGGQPPESIGKWRPAAVRITNDHFDAASLAWRGYRAPTPQRWFDLTREDLSALPQLRPTVLELLEELPMRSSGLGATEMRLLELIAEGGASPADIFAGHEKRNTRRVFGYWEIGSLLDGLAHCPAPAVSGLEEGPFTLEMHDDRARRRRYNQSRLSLAPLGEAILAGRDDFSRHNPIHRWWGGTELTNDRLWRWDPESRALVAP